MKQEFRYDVRYINWLRNLFNNLKIKINLNYVHRSVAASQGNILHLLMLFAETIGFFCEYKITNRVRLAIFVPIRLSVRLSPTNNTTNNGRILITLYI
jgi:hypothetical protein